MALKIQLLVAVLLFCLCFAKEDVVSSQQNKKRFYDDQGNYNISFYHINDIHAHLNEIKASTGSGKICTDLTAGCVGGYSRVLTKIKETRAQHPDSLFLSCGDEFQETFFYQHYKGAKIAEAINQLGFNGMTLGNHEFNGGDQELGEFLSNLTFPILAANIQSSHPLLNATIKPFHIYPQYELAVIGVTTNTTSKTSKPGPGTTFSDPFVAVQNTIDFIRGTTDIKRIVVITHIGYEEDQKLAEQTRGLHLIMGGHSHTPLGDIEGSKGPYPTIRKNKDGEDVFIVTAFKWGEYLGYFDVVYDPEGRIISFHGAPIHLTNTTIQYPKLQAQVVEWQKPFPTDVVGTSLVYLDQSRCHDPPIAKECLLGDLVADAMLSHYHSITPTTTSKPTADFALINGRGIRQSIDIGSITSGEVLESFPYKNFVVGISITGDELWNTIEGALSLVNQFNHEEVPSGIQLSRGIRITFDPEAKSGSKLVSVDIGMGKGGLRPLEKGRVCNVVTLDFLAKGSDNIFQTKEFDDLDVNDESRDDLLRTIVARYMNQTSPIDITLDGRITAVNGTKAESSATRDKNRISSLSLAILSAAFIAFVLL